MDNTRSTLPEPMTGDSCGRSASCAVVFDAPKASGSRGRSNVICLADIRVSPIGHRSPGPSDEVNPSSEDRLQPPPSDLMALSGALVVELVCLTHDVEEHEILAKRRGVQRISHARQMVMYLLHTAMGFSYQDISEWMGKDRTTIAHACGVIEDLRDEAGFDQWLSRIEAVIAKTVDLAYA